MLAYKIARGAALGAALAILPAAAFAVNVSANDGNGEQHRTYTYSNGAKVSGDLKSTSGKTVYYSGKVALGGCSDPDKGRYSSNTSSRTAVTRGGTITETNIGTCTFQGVKSRVCTVINNLPDACGPDSSTY